MGSNPWTRFLFKTKDTIQEYYSDLPKAVLTSSAILCERISAFLSENPRRVSEVQHSVILWIFNCVVPYLSDLLAYEISNLSASLEHSSTSSDQHSHSDERQQCIHRCEQKIYSLKACASSTSRQIDQVLSTWTAGCDGIDAGTECDKNEEVHSNYKELKERILHFELCCSKALDLVLLHKNNHTSDLQIELTNLQIRENRQAIAQANTVAKLTVLAFVFIPISTVTGVFGMNVQEIVHGTRIWMFGVTTALVVIATLLLACGSSILSWLRFYLPSGHEVRGPAWLRDKRIQFIVHPPLMLWKLLCIWKDWFVFTKSEGEKLRKKDREELRRGNEYDLNLRRSSALPPTS